MTRHDEPGVTDNRVLGRWVWGRVRAAWPVIAVVAAIIVTAVLTARSPDGGLPLDPSSTGPTARVPS